MRMEMAGTEGGSEVLASHTILFTQSVPIVIFRAIGNLTFCHFLPWRLGQVEEMSARVGA